MALFGQASFPYSGIVCFPLFSRRPFCVKKILSFPDFWSFLTNISIFGVSANARFSRSDLADGQLPKRKFSYLVAFSREILPVVELPFLAWWVVGVVSVWEVGVVLPVFVAFLFEWP